MIPDAGHVAAALAGAFRLLRFDWSGFQFFDRTMDGLWRSFFCAVLILPLYVLLIALRLDETELANPALRILLVEAIAYVIGWTAFPLIMAFLANVLDRAEHYPGYIVAYNWSAAPQVVLTLAVALPRAAGLLPGALETGLGLGLMLYLLAVQWFIARRALDLHPGAALGVVVVDFLISAFVAAVTAAMLARPAGA
ncbi:MAG: hypothetical protein ACT4N4_04135 [Rhodospirillales bacterium]